MATSFSYFNHGNLNFSINTKSQSSGVNMTKVLAMAKPESFWASIEAEIDSYLKAAIPIRPPDSVFEPMHHLAFAAPRTTAPALCVAACELFGGERSQAMAAASAIHLMHAAAHTHEHLPLTDRPRPRPTPTPNIKHMYGPNIELLTGDGILPFGFELLARSMELPQSDPTRIIRVIAEIARASGSEGIVDGQYKELEMDESSGLEVIEDVCRRKEGRMHGCAAACGAILGGGADEEVEKLRSFGVYAGMVRGLMARENGNGVMEENIERLKELAVNELGSFHGNEARLELISSLVESRYN